MKLVDMLNMFRQECPHCHLKGTDKEVDKQARREFNDLIVKITYQCTNCKHNWTKTQRLMNNYRR